MCLARRGGPPCAKDMPKDKALVHEGVHQPQEFGFGVPSGQRDEKSNIPAAARHSHYNIDVERYRAPYYRMNKLSLYLCPRALWRSGPAQNPSPRGRGFWGEGSQ